ncbi:MAG: hypothetical protein HKN26_07290 [Acidimicrobiales bacterium]|nr:hypothetical protein [Acidimicrobiales bacterium]
MTALEGPVTPFGSVVGQPLAIEHLDAAANSPLHAYLFVGPRGAGKRAAAAAFAGEILARSGAGVTDPAAADRTRRLAVAEQHPDIFMFEPEGNQLRIGNPGDPSSEEVKTLIREASRSPVESAYKIVVCDRFHTAPDGAAAAMLKAVEEPPPTAVWILLAENVPPEHVALASRCGRIDFPPVSAGPIAEALMAEGVAADIAAELASAAGGNIDRARLLATDPQFLARRNAWRAVPDTLDGTGGKAAALVDEIRLLIDEAGEPLAEKQTAEVAAMAEREEQLGTRGSGRASMVARHKREVRLLRADELRLGLATLAAQYRDGIDTAPDAKARVAAIATIDAAADALHRNPNEKLLLQALFYELPTL